MARSRTLAAVLVTTALASTALVTAGPSVADDVDRAPLRSIVRWAAEYTIDEPTGVVRGANGETFVAYPGSNVVAVFGRTASGAAKPTRIIAGSATGLSSPGSLALDRQGYLYVVNRDPDRITVFAPGASGNARPVRTLVGAATGLDGISDVAVDADGTLYVTNAEATPVTVYRPGARGNVAPWRKITSSEGNLYAPRGLTVAPNGRLYVLTDDDRILAFPKQANGDLLPILTISGPDSALYPISIDADSASRLYVTDFLADRVSVFGPNHGRYAPPLRSLVGDPDHPRKPGALDVGPDHVITITGWTPDENGFRGVLTYGALYAPPAPKPTPKVTVPSAVRHLAVAGRARAKKRLVRWRRPARSGGATVNRYAVVVKRGHKVVHRETSRRTRVVLTRRELRRAGTLRPGRYRVIVRAHNRKGYGPAVTRTFRVRR